MSQYGNLGSDWLRKGPLWVRVAVAIFVVVGSIVSSVACYVWESSKYDNAKLGLGGFVYGYAAFAAACIVIAFGFRRTYRRWIGSPWEVVVWAALSPLIAIFLANVAVAVWKFTH
jgi:hypothetical protein